MIFLVQDEARFGRITQPRKCWAPRGMRPCTPHQIIREAIYAFTAIAPQYGKMISLILPTANTDMMEIFLEHISKEFIGSFIVRPRGWSELASITAITSSGEYSIDFSTSL